MTDINAANHPLHMLDLHAFRPRSRRPVAVSDAGEEGEETMKPAHDMSCQIGTLLFRVYNVSNDKQHVNVEVISDDGEVGNIDCSMSEWRRLERQAAL